MIMTFSVENWRSFRERATLQKNTRQENFSPKMLEDPL